MRAQIKRNTRDKYQIVDKNPFLMHISYTFDLIHDDIVSIPTIHTHYYYDSMLNVVTKCKNGMDSLRTFDGGSYFFGIMANGLP